ncbi:MAG: hypothetical protein H6867_07190 [Rhodospirillales bacterium]|nr:hypothetical protein [Rhodospirillales bacterium]MCB9995335.1 hypothetical protein [Rhodospirillales bacterium]
MSKKPLRTFFDWASSNFGDPEEQGLEFKGNVRYYSDLRLPNENYRLGRPKKPEGSTISDEQFRTTANERQLIGLYGPK